MNDVAGAICQALVRGAFLKRQDEVSEKFSKLNVEIFCNAKNLWEEMMFGRLKDKFGELIQGHAERFFDTTVGASKPVATMVLGTVGRCRLTVLVSKPVWKAPMVSALEATI